MKITLDSIVSGFKSVTKLISNFDKIEDDLNNKVLYRDNPEGEPNQMQNDLDMNSQRIVNLVSPVNDSEPARWADVKNGVTGIDEPVPSQTGNAKTPLTTNGTGLVFGQIEADHVDFTPASGPVTDVQTQLLAIDAVLAETGTVDDKELLSKGFNSSLASLPRLYRKLTEYNESTSTQIKVVGMGSSVGNGAGTSDPATFSPVVQFANRVEAKFNKLGIYNIVTSNQSVNGSTLSGGAADIDSVLSSEQPDVILLAYGMNDGGTSQYNANMSYPFVEANLKTIISKCHEADCDVIVCTTPHPNTDTQSFSMNPVLAMNYPTASWTLTEGFSFTSGPKQINSTTSGAFTNTANGFGLTVGRKINISGTASNDGDYTIATIDGSGDFITVSEVIVTEALVTCTIKRNTILDSELVPTVVNSTPSIDALGYGVGNEVIVSHRHYRVNQAMRKAAIESGVSVVDVEHYWFEAVHTAGGVAALYGVGETVHPNDAGYTQSYNYGLFDFVDSISESYVLGVQQNSLLPSVYIETSRRTASLEVGQKSTSTEVATFSNEAGAALLTVDGTSGVVFDSSVDLVAGGVVQQVTGNAAVTTSVGSKFNQTAAWDVPTTTDSQGKIIITATQSGIGKQCVEYGFSNNAGTTTVIQAFTVGSSVLTSVTGSGDNIVITPAAANTNIRWQLVEIT